MKIKDRTGRIYNEEEKTEALLQKIYSSPLSRACMKLLCMPFVSKAGGMLLSTRLSAGFVDFYAEKNNIDMFDYEDKQYTSFNDFFTRKIKKGRRFITADASALVCPSDGKVSAYSIAKTDIFVIKNSVYNVASLLRDKKLAKKYAGGTAVVIRLTPDDYHHYIYPADGVKSHDRFISGRLNTVRPIINKFEPVFKENSRSYCMIRTEKFGDIIQMEVGAMMVGKITNHKKNKSAVKRGEEKGYFEFGGSTIVLLLEPGRAEVCADLLENTEKGWETKLRMGDVIAEA